MNKTNKLPRGKMNKTANNNLKVAIPHRQVVILLQVAILHLKVVLLNLQVGVIIHKVIKNHQQLARRN